MTKLRNLAVTICIASSAGPAHAVDIETLPISSSAVLIDHIMKAKQPTEIGLDLWLRLVKASENSVVATMLVTIASNKPEWKTVPGFENDWHYFRAMAADNDGDSKKVLEELTELKLRDRYFAQSQYLKGMAMLEMNRIQDALAMLNSLLIPETIANSSLEADDRQQLLDYTHLALARLSYQQRQFDQAIHFYRRISKDSPSYYEALFEQSWALFLGGYHQHSLGTLYGAESMFFADRLNPEAYVLKSFVYYWICRYDDSEFALQQFTEVYNNRIAPLESFLKRTHLNPATGYQLFEDLVSGVSSEALGLPRSILNLAATTEPMVVVRNQYALLLEEQRILREERSSTLRDSRLKVIDQWIDTTQKAIGETFISELKELKMHFDKLFDQGQFLEVELLMSQKEQLLGKELHASLKLKKEKTTVSGWSDDQHSWGLDKRKEYWWDEIGFHIVPVEPGCKMK